jgi:hypothetical protein
MSKALRLSEKWFRRGLWLVAFVFAGFLIGLGGTVVGDLPKVEQRLELDGFLDRPAANKLRSDIQAAQRASEAAQAALEQARLKLQVARSDSNAARETFNHWLATRSATQRAEQDPELIARTRALDGLKQAERSAQAAVEQQQQAALDARQGETRARRELGPAGGCGHQWRCFCAVRARRDSVERSRSSCAFRRFDAAPGRPRQWHRGPALLCLPVAVQKPLK